MHTARRSTVLGPLVRIILLAVPVLLLFAATGFLLLALLSWVPGARPFGLGSLLPGALCGLIAWLFLAAFHIRTETVHLPAPDRRVLCDDLVPLLQELGYEVKARGDGWLLARPAFHALLLGGRIQVSVDGGTARLTGPKVFVEVLRRRARMKSHMAHAALAGEVRVRSGERRLKRVQLSVRVEGEHGQGVYEEVLRALAKEGTRVMCAMHILAQSDDGIPEQSVEEVRRRLLSREIPIEIRKDFPQWEEPMTVSVETTPTPSSRRARRDQTPGRPGESSASTPPARRP